LGRFPFPLLRTRPVMLWPAKRYSPIALPATRPSRVENKFGPSLAGVFGRKSGTEPGYAYSSALKGQNVTWDEANLDAWLQGPGKFVRGTKMIYSVPEEKDRQDVIAYLRTLSK
jgi:cytochrome c2